VHDPQKKQLTGDLGMKTKRFSIFYLLLTAASTTAIAQPSIPQEHFPVTNDRLVERFPLTPTAESATGLLNMQADVYESGRIVVNGSVDLYANKGDFAVHISVDATNGTYTAVPYSPEELKQVNLRHNLERTSAATKKAQELKSAGKYDSAQAQAQQAGNYGIFLTLLTEDPPQIDLAETTTHIRWQDDGTNVTATYAYPTFWANPSTPLFTTWYVYAFGAAMSTPLNSPSTYTHAYANGIYINYDWADDDIATWVEHVIEFDFYPMLPTGQVGTHDFSFQELGEHAELLHTNDLVVDFYWY
jgi:hypothetical protein